MAASHPHVWVDEHNPNDVLKGKGNGINNWPGNVKFREIVKNYQPAYIAAHRSQRPRYSFLVVDEIKKLNPPGRFLKRDEETERWYEIEESEALEKARQALSEKPKKDRGKRKDESEKSKTIARSERNDNNGKEKDNQKEFFESNPAAAGMAITSSVVGSRGQEETTRSRAAPQMVHSFVPDQVISVPATERSFLAKKKESDKISDATTDCRDHIGDIDVRVTPTCPLDEDGGNDDYYLDSINTNEIMSILDGVSSMFEPGGGREGDMAKNIEVSVANSWDMMKTRDVDSAHPMSSAMSLLSDLTSKMDLNETGMSEVLASMTRSKDMKETAAASSSAVNFNDGESLMSQMSLSSMFSPEKHRELLGIGSSASAKNVPSSSSGDVGEPPRHEASSSLPDARTSAHGPKTVEASMLESVSTFQPEDSFGDLASFGPDLFQPRKPDDGVDVNGN